jgi:predicted SPOUT superfamily RNA methylase MTH1
MEVTASKSHQQRKIEAKLQKRQRIEQSGGIRPRSSTKNEATISANHHQNAATIPSSTHASTFVKDHRRDRSTTSSSQHRFGRVMENVPCRKIPRYSTVSIAIPSSILYNCQTRELKTILCGQIARAATIYHVDEIIIYNDGTTKSNGSNHIGQTHSFDRYSSKRRRDDSKHENDSMPKVDDDSPSKDTPNTTSTTAARTATSDPQIFMARILQYCECPQYLRKHFFPIHSDLQFSGLLAPIDAPHHVRADDRCKYREGVVLQQQPTSITNGSLVNCGIRNRPVLYVPA